MQTRPMVEVCNFYPYTAATLLADVFRCKIQSYTIE